MALGAQVGHGLSRCPRRVEVRHTGDVVVEVAVRWVQDRRVLDDRQGAGRVGSRAREVSDLQHIGRARGHRDEDAGLQPADVVIARDGGSRGGACAAGVGADLGVIRGAAAGRDLGVTREVCCPSEPDVVVYRRGAKLVAGGLVLTLRTCRREGVVISEGALTSDRCGGRTGVAPLHGECGCSEQGEGERRQDGFHGEFQRIGGLFSE